MQRIKQGINIMMNDVDVDLLEIAWELLRWSVKMDKNQVINLHHVHTMLLLDKNVNSFQEKLKAWSSLIMLYTMESEVMPGMAKIDFIVTCSKINLIQGVFFNF